VSLPSFDPLWLWLGVGVVMLIAEVLISHGFFLSLAISGFAMAALFGNFGPLSETQFLWQAAAYAALSMILLAPCRYLLRRFVTDDKPDINKY